MDTKFQQIKKRFDEAAKRKVGFDNLYRDALRFTVPERELFTGKAEGTTKRNNIDVVDSTAMIALSKYVSNLQSSLVPPMRKWTKLVPGDAIPDEMLDTVKLKLEEVTNIMFSALSNSNFDTQIAEAFSDLAIGTSAMLCVKGDNEQMPLRFVTVPLNELYIDEGPYGKIDTVYRKHSIENRNIKGTWEDAKLPEKLQTAISEKPSEKSEFLECTYPDKVSITKMVADAEGKMQKKTFEVQGFRYLVLHEATKSIIVEREQESTPWVVFRWSVAPGEIYGRGPVLFALPDIKSINKLKEIILKNAALQTTGVYLAKEDSVINFDNIQLEPGAIIPVSNTGGGMSEPSLAPLPIAGNLQLGDLQYRELVAKINDIMFADPLGPIDLPVKTATEVSYRQQELAKRIGSSFGRLQYELIAPLINRILYVLNEQGLLPTFGDSVSIDGYLIGIKHESPLSTAQDQESVMAIQQFIQFLASVFGPNALALIQPDKVVMHMAKYLNVPADIQLTSDQMNAVKQKVAQMGQVAEQSVAQQVASGQPIK
jgi:hypothetical protein